MRKEMETAIHGAAEEGDLAMVAELVEEDPGVVHRTDGIGWTALHYASEYGHEDIATYLLDHGADINARDVRGWTPLYSACANDHLVMVVLLVSKGADPTITDSHDGGSTPLMIAAAWGHVAIVHYLLLNRGVRATVDDRDADGETALWGAAFDGHEGVVSVLVEAGADPMVGDDMNTTPAQIAKLRGHHHCVELLQVGEETP